MTLVFPETPKRREPEASGPLFSKAQRRFGLLLAERLLASGFRLFLPQRDDVAREILPKTNDHRPAANTVFRLDRQQALDRHAFLFVGGRCGYHQGTAHRYNP